MKSKLASLIFLLIITVSSTAQLKSTMIQTIQSFNAITRIMQRIHYLTGTSCKVAAKFILLTICNIQDKKELPILKLSGDSVKDLRNIRALLMQGLVLQIEIRSNHHFIIFKKDNEKLYLLQAFQDRIRLSSWIKNNNIMSPYLTIDDFFTKFKELLDPQTPIDTVEQLLLDLFLPPIFTTDEDLIKRTLDYFRGRPVTLINVNYAKFDFSLNHVGKEFNSLFNYVDHHYYIY